MATLELEARLEGSAKTPGEQAIDDAVASLTRVARDSAASSGIPQGKASVEVPKRGRLTKLPRGTPLRGSTGNMEEEGVLKLLHDELSLVGAPIMTQIGGTANPGEI